LLLRQPLLQPRPTGIGLLQIPPRIGGEGGAVLFPAEQIKPVLRHDEEPGVAAIGNAPRQVDRVVTAKPGSVDFRMSHKGGAVAVVAKTPDGTGLGRDHTIFATRPGIVEFKAGRKGRVVSVADA